MFGFRTWQGYLDDLPGELGRMREILADVAPVVGHRPWPRGRIGQMAWDMAVDKLVTGELTMLSLWADAKVVHMALLVENSAEIAVVSWHARTVRFRPWELTSSASTAL